MQIGQYTYSSLFLQVKNDVLPVQTSEGQRIRTEVQAFIKRVADYQRSFHQRSFYKYATGAANAYPAIDQVRHIQKWTALPPAASRSRLGCQVCLL